MALNNTQLNKLDGISRLYTDDKTSSAITTANTYTDLKISEIELLYHYLAVVSQNGTDAPLEVADKIIINTMGAVWVYNYTGMYSLFALGAFPTDAQVDIDISSNNGWMTPMAYIKAERVNDGNIDFEVGLNDAFTSSPTQTPTDGLLNRQRIEIKVYKV